MPAPQGAATQGWDGCPALEGVFRIARAVDRPKLWPCAGPLRLGGPPALPARLCRGWVGGTEGLPYAAGSRWPAGWLGAAGCLAPRCAGEPGQQPSRAVLPPCPAWARRQNSPRGVVGRAHCTDRGEAARTAGEHRTAAGATGHSGRPARVSARPMRVQETPSEAVRQLQHIAPHIGICPAVLTPNQSLHYGYASRHSRRHCMRRYRPAPSQCMPTIWSTGCWCCKTAS